jgi:hypothetical protein
MRQAEGTNVKGEYWAGRHFVSGHGLITGYNL